MISARERLGDGDVPEDADDRHKDDRGSELSAHLHEAQSLVLHLSREGGKGESRQTRLHRSGQDEGRPGGGLELVSDRRADDNDDCVSRRRYQPDGFGDRSLTLRQLLSDAVKIQVFQSLVGFEIVIISFSFLIRLSE